MLFTSHYLRNFGHYCNVLIRFTLNTCKSIAVIHYKNLIWTLRSGETMEKKKKNSTQEDGEGHHHRFRFFLCVTELGVAGDIFF